jgi:hypothetical protein
MYLLKSIHLEDQRRNGRMIIYFIACQKLRYVIYVRIYGSGPGKSLFDLFIRETFFVMNCVGHVWR